MKKLKAMGIYSLIVIVLSIVLYKWPTNHKIIGGDKDAGGCLVGAGYTWCEIKQKCLRVWEEPCQTSTTKESFNHQGYLKQEDGLWFLIYEQPGQPAIRANLYSDSNTYSNGEIWTSGDRVNLQGNIIPSPISKWIEAEVLNLEKIK